ncbi:MAG: hypothetical protein L3J09_12315 [Flavobacteriaceae bacterium]|nr:hypothetical protein [Flavobacteriaceae bacterium]
MKKYLIVFAAVLTYFNSYAQDPQLFENDWYLQKVIVDGEDFFPPSQSFVTELYFYSDSFNYIYAYCNFGWSTDVINYNINNIEFILDAEFIGLGDGCSDPDYLDFMSLHDNTYYMDYIVPLNPFAYSIFDDGAINPTFIYRNHYAAYLISLC